MASKAYALRADHQDTYGGGVLHVGDRSFDVQAELDAGGGAIVVDDSDTLLQEVLDGYPALKRVAIGEARAVNDKAASKAEVKTDAKGDKR